MVETCNIPDSTKQEIRALLKSAIASGAVELKKLPLTKGGRSGVRYVRYIDIGILLILAMKSGKAEIVEILMTRASIKKEKGPILSITVELNIAEYAHILIGKSDDALKDPSLLSQAVEIGNSDIVKILLENGAAIPDDGKSLEKAVEYSKVEILKILLDNGIGAKKEYDILRRAFELGNNEIIETLLTYAAEGKGIPADPYYNSLHLAAKYGNHFICHLILRKGGVDVNETTRHFNDTTALHLAVERNDPFVANLLCEYGADTELRQDWMDITQATSTPLLFAAARSFTKVAEVLLRFGANITNLHSQNQTPLGYAIKEGSPEILQKFLNYRFTAINDLFVKICWLSIKFLKEGLIKARCDSQSEHPLGSLKDLCSRKMNILLVFMIKVRLARPECLSHDDIEYLKRTAGKVFSRIESEAEAEIKKMKEKKIFDSCEISFFDFLTADDQHLKNYLSSYEIVRALKEGWPMKQFPHYRNILACQLAKAEGQKMLSLLRGCEICSLLIKPFPLLKWNLKEQMRILNTMDNYELQHFIDAWLQYSKK